MERKVAYLQRHTGLAVSDVVRAAIEHYYDSVRSGGARSRELLEASGFIGSGEGPSDLSERYKEHFAALQGEKHS